MASSSKRRRTSSSKQSSAGKARVIAAKRAEALPRKGNVSTGRRKPVVQPPIDALLESLATAVATKTPRAAGRASGKPKKPAAMKVRRAAAVEPGTAEVATPAPVAEKLETPEVEALAFLETEVEMTEVEMEVEASAIVEETTIVDARFALAVEAVTFPNKEIGPLPACEEMRAPPLAHTTVASPVPVAPAPHHGKRALVTVVSQLLSTLRRWTGIRF